MKIQIKILNSRGAAHVVLPLLVIVGVAITGTYFIVASNAQTPPTGGGGTPAKFVCSTSTISAVKSASGSLAGKYTQYVVTYKATFKNTGTLSSYNAPAFGLGLIASAGSQAGTRQAVGSSAFTLPVVFPGASYTLSKKDTVYVFKSDVSHKYFAFLQSSRYQVGCSASVTVKY